MDCPDRGQFTFNMLNLSSSEASESSLVLGSRDSSRAHVTLNVDDGGRGGGSSLASGQRLFGRHDVVNWICVIDPR